MWLSVASDVLLLLPHPGSEPAAPHQAWHRDYIVFGRLQCIRVNRIFFSISTIFFLKIISIFFVERPAVNENHSLYD